VAGESGGRGTRHVAGVAAVVVDVAQHVVPEQPLQGEPLAAVGAREGGRTGSTSRIIISGAGLLLFLPLAVVQEFYLNKIQLFISELQIMNQIRILEGGQWIRIWNPDPGRENLPMPVLRIWIRDPVPF
jgi:hypothetical protein